MSSDDGRNYICDFFSDAWMFEWDDGGDFRYPETYWNSDFPLDVALKNGFVDVARLLVGALALPLCPVGALCVEDCDSVIYEESQLFDAELSCIQIVISGIFGHCGEIAWDRILCTRALDVVRG